MQVSEKEQNNVHVRLLCVLSHRVKHWSRRSEWEGCVRFGAVDGAIAPELYVRLD